MLRSFRVANHRSIRDEQELLLMPAYDKQRPVVPVAAIFGANASGKSNLLDALSFMQRAVRTSYSHWEPGTGVPREPFVLDSVSAARPSLYVVELELDSVRYTYGFTVDNDQVRAEWLYAYPRGRKRVVFERNADQIDLGSTINDPQLWSKTLKRTTRKNALLLCTAALADLPEVLPAYRWFSQGLTSPDSSSPMSLRRLADRLNAADPDRHKVVDLVRAADLGISDIVIEDAGVATEGEMSRASVHTGVEMLFTEAMAQLSTTELPRRGRDRRELIFLQGAINAPLTIRQQSAGTQAWLGLLDWVLTALEQGRLLLVDEIDTSLHPRLTARLIELFRDDRVNTTGAQLVFATHDASLLGTSFGRDVLARDQIWFVEKDDDGATMLFPLTDFHPRKDENTERRYLGGSYGAVPAVFSDTLVDAYLGSRVEVDDGPA